MDSEEEALGGARGGGSDKGCGRDDWTGGVRSGPGNGGEGGRRTGRGPGGCGAVDDWVIES